MLRVLLVRVKGKRLKQRFDPKKKIKTELIFYSSNDGHVYHLPVQEENVTVTDN